ncbi:hypothetical protein COLO4_15555 [Corchorus olitorius]|uniref:mRNA guanylyltransferase n=1 Tax=Corchorus olitorius TaxID=93759 RepID=A0A1R3JMC0_9ROSI|nr:hypothetical protein COLO4_15555 [Corchorus olitorius]
MNDNQFYQTGNFPRNLDNNGIPSGWLDCPSLGHEILGCILPSKVPLSESYQGSIPPCKIYSFNQVIQWVENSGRNLGLVIDLTNTSRYYSVSDLKQRGIDHVKIRCKGRDSVPDNFAVNTFVYEVLKFFSRQTTQDSKDYVLVHCTHGHNRTGFMIVHLLMRSQPLISVSQAIEIFAQARPPGIYKPDYIDALYSFYNETKPGIFACPPLPQWKANSPELNFNGNHNLDDVSVSVADQSASAAMTNHDVLGDEIPFHQMKSFREFCYEMLKINVKGYLKFPGSHPVSLNKDNLQLLRQHYYYATWKADGTRYLMLITLDGCYLIDRKFNFRRVQIRFPSICKKNRSHHYTLLDGEMVIDTLPGTQKKERRYLIYDIIAINGETLIGKPFFERWNMLEKQVIEPRNKDRYVCQSRNCSYRYELESFRVRRKDFWLLSTVPKILKEFIPKLSHEADGLIFQGRDDPYIPCTHEGLLKWKSAEMNSVDFLFEMGVGNCDQKLFLHERGKRKLMEGHRVEFRDGSNPCSCSGMIVECSWDCNKMVWVYMRKRTDKSTPNDFNTYSKVMRSIRDNITQETVLKEIDEILRLPMYIYPDTHLHTKSC